MEDRLRMLVESRIHGDMYVRFGGEYMETYYSNIERRWVLSLLFAEAGFPQPRTPWSPALFPKSRIIWENLKPNASHLKPKPADVFGIYFTNLKRIAHVGFVDDWGDKYVITVEGNTNEAGSNEGDGVYKKRRLISSIYQVADWVQGQERRIE